MVSLEAHQEALYQAAYEEREAYLKYLEKTNDKNGFGITSEDEIAHKFRRATFHQFLNTTKLKVCIIEYEIFDIFDMYVSWYVDECLFFHCDLK